MFYRLKGRGGRYGVFAGNSASIAIIAGRSAIFSGMGGSGGEQAKPLSLEAMSVDHFLSRIADLSPEPFPKQRRAKQRRMPYWGC
ncbi:MAG: hypothetical protein ACE5OZ_08050 [Candidatus Heimdallarchaeota archaeon]